MKSQKTNKLFYKKWPFKIVCYLKGSYYAVRLNDAKFYEWVNSLGIYSSQPWHHSKPFDKSAVAAFRSIITPFIGQDTKFRAESGIFNIYCKDSKMFSKIAQAVQPWVTEVWEPASEEELTYLLSNTDKKQIRDTLPYDKFKYKVFIKVKFEPSSRERFLEWALKYPDTIRVSKSTLLWLAGTRKYFTMTPFMYVTDEKMLSMVHLYLGSNIGRVEEFILRDGINTP